MRVFRPLATTYRSGGVWTTLDVERTTIDETGIVTHTEAELLSRDKETSADVIDWEDIPGGESVMAKSPGGDPLGARPRWLFRRGRIYNPSPKVMAELEAQFDKRWFFEMPDPRPERVERVVVPAQLTAESQIEQLRAEMDEMRVLVASVLDLLESEKAAV